MARSLPWPASISTGRYFCISTIQTRCCCATPPSAESPSARAGKLPPMERRLHFERRDLESQDLESHHLKRGDLERDDLEGDDGLLARRQRAPGKRRRTRNCAPPDRRNALPQSASVSPAAARRQAETGTGAGLGAEPLLLPEHHSDQGRGGDLALPRSRHPARMAAQNRRP